MKKPEITVVSLNPCMDWQYTVPSFKYGGLNRVNRTYSGVSGKGINVCKALKNLGLDPLCVGFNFTKNGAVLTETLDAHGIRYDFVDVNREIRVNIKLYDESTGLMTEINQPGEFVNNEAQLKLSRKINDLASNGHSADDILIISGSLPKNVKETFYADLCALWPGKTIVDTDGEALRQILKNIYSRPFVIKPNLFELESTFGVKLKTPVEIVKFCREKLSDVYYSCISMGADGVVFVSPSAAYYYPALKIKAKGLQGAGDAMVAGLVYGMANNLPEEDILLTAVAAATATITLEGTKMCTRKVFETMLAKTSLDFLHILAIADTIPR